MGGESLEETEWIGTKSPKRMSIIDTIINRNSEDLNDDKTFEGEGRNYIYEEFEINEPINMKLLTLKKVAQVSQGTSHILMMTDDFKIFSWGDNKFGYNEFNKKSKRKFKRKFQKKI